MQRFDRRYLAWGGGMAAAAALPLIAGYTSLGWELSEILGLAGALGCVALCGSPLRPRAALPAVLLNLRRHAALGWTVLAAAVTHALIATLADPTVIQYWKLTAPLYLAAGWAAMVTLALLVLASVGPVRRRWWRSHRSFQASHIIAGCGLLVLVAAHVAATGRYAGGYPRRILYLGISMGAIAMLLRRRRTNALPADTGWLRQGVFGRHSRLVVTAITGTALVLVLLVPGRSVLALRQPLAARADTLPLNFDHRFHTSVNCLECHHNYADGRGFDACIACHRSARADLKLAAEARFHGFCMNCHRSPLRLLTQHGPVSGCVTCHRPPPK